MKKIDTSFITPIAGMPLKSGGLDHLQSAYQEGIQQMAIPLIGKQYNTTDYFIMQGCKNTGSGSNYIISAGGIYRNNEWFVVDAVTFTAPMDQTAVGTITTTFFTSANADPTTFTDGIAHNVNVVRKIVFAAGVSGSGDVDFNNLEYVGLEDKHIVGGAGEPAFQNSWVSAGILGFRADWSNKLLFFEGESSKMTYTGGSEVICTMPSKYWPSIDRFHQFVSKVGTADYRVFELELKSSNGELSIICLDGTFTATNIVIIFDGISFFIN